MSVGKVQIAKELATPTNVIVVGGVIVITSLVGYFGIIRPVMKKFGLIEDRKAIKNILKVSDYKGFDPNFHRMSKVTLSPDRAKILADKVYDAHGFINDDEVAFLSVLQEAGTADNLSYVAKIFNLRHNASIGDYYVWYMDSPQEIERIKAILLSYK